MSTCFVNMFCYIVHMQTNLEYTARYIDIKHGLLNDNLTKSITQLAEWNSNCNIFQKHVSTTFFNMFQQHVSTTCFNNMFCSFKWYPIWYNITWFDLIWSNLIRFDPIWSNLIQFDPIWSNSIKFDPIYSNLIKFEPIWSNLIQFDPTSSNAF